MKDFAFKVSTARSDFETSDEEELLMPINEAKLSTALRLDEFEEESEFTFRIAEDL